ncbi:MAG: 2-oxo acid dehydrogenase subunit E2 [Armatimonadetes bacterium]|nr:2-oxo acid dehydrogenase subunit E2 [Armatimonadota bacterium]
MAKLEFRLPDVGEGLADVEVVKWLVALGADARENEPLVDVETDKAVVTIPSPASGKVLAHAVPEGKRLAVGAVLATIEVESEAALRAAAPSHGAVGHGSGATASVAPAAGVEDPVAPSALAGPVRAAPAVRKLAAELGIPLEALRGSGPQGRIMFEDVRNYAAKAGAPVAKPVASAPTPAAPAISVATGASGDTDRVPLRGVRRRGVEAMLKSVQSIPHVTGFQEFDASALVALRLRLQPHAQAAGVKLTFLPFLVKAAVRALQKHPYFNATVTDDGDDPAIVYKKFYNTGIAVSARTGLVVAVIHGADKLGLLDLARRADELAQSCRAGTVPPEALRNGTFTITNVGPRGGWFATSIIRHPETAILGLGRIEDRAVVRDGQIVARPILPVSFSFDHRVADGEEALTFFEDLRHLIENPEVLLLGEPMWPGAMGRPS